MAKAHVYKRDHINTDEIIPARYLNTDDAAELGKHCLEDLDPDFVKKCRPGDVIVAGIDPESSDRLTFNAQPPTDGNDEPGLDSPSESAAHAPA